MYEWIADESVRGRIAEKMDEIAPLDENSAEFERFIREEMVQSSFLAKGEYIAFAENLRVHLIHEKELSKELVALSFFAFEWPHRKVVDSYEQQKMFLDILQQWDNRFKSHAICCYALSRYNYFFGDADKERALKFARDACAKAPGNGGFLNNYAEILLEKAEAAILSSTDSQEVYNEAELKGILEDFDSIDEDSYYPSFYVSRGRLHACLGEYDEADSEFSQARRLAMKMREEKSARMADEGAFVGEMGKIDKAQSSAAIMKASQAFKGSIEAMREEEKRRDAALTEKINAMTEDVDSRVSAMMGKVNGQVDEMTERMNSQRIEMLEFLGFFSGIISFVVASIQIGSDMDFTARALLILVMSGALLAVFGALGMMLDAYSALGKPQQNPSRASRALRIISAKSIGVIGVGLVLIVIGLAASVLI